MITEEELALLKKLPEHEWNFGDLAYIYTILHCSHVPHEPVYENMLHHVYLPEVIRRLKENILLNEAIKLLKELNESEILGDAGSWISEITVDYEEDMKYLDDYCERLTAFLNKVEEK